MSADWLWFQFALVGWGALCFFAHGARSNGIPLNRKTWFGIAQAVVIVVLLFGLLSDWRGCSRMPDADTLCVGEANC